MDKIAFAQLIGFIGAISKTPLDRHQVEHVEYITKVSNGTPPNVDDVHTLMNAMAADRKIEAIKAHRTLTGYGLKESKDAIESVMCRATADA